MTKRRFVDNTRLGRELARLEEEDPEVRKAADELDRVTRKIIGKGKKGAEKNVLHRRVARVEQERSSTDCDAESVGDTTRGR